MTHLVLQGLRFYAYHGVLPQERIVGAYYTIDLDVDMDFRKALFSDSLKDTINYAAIYQLVESEMKQPSRLVEHVAGRILQALFTTYPSVSAIHLRLLKDTPPVSGFDGKGCGVEVDFTRENFFSS